NHRLSVAQDRARRRRDRVACRRVSAVAPLARGKVNAMATKSLKKAEAALRKLALAYPHVVEDHPWGHSAFKVKGKTFLFLSGEANELSLSVKLPDSHRLALLNRFAAPTGYGLGKSGWITATFKEADEAPLDLLGEWLEESFRAVAPKKVLREWEGG